MNSTIKKINFVTIFLVCLTLNACKKFLDKKSNQELVVFTTLRDLQAMLDNNSRVNQMDPATAERCSDNYYLLEVDWPTYKDKEDGRAYLWADSYLFPPGNANEWGNVYDNVYRANVVLDNLDKIIRIPNDQAAWNDIKGQALFIRAKSFLLAAVVWTLSYDENTSSNDLGIPLRLSSDFNLPTTRSTLKQTYDQITNDLKEAASLLPDVSIHPLRPSKPAAYAFLSRTYLAMLKYDEAFNYANLCLQMRNYIIDYNANGPDAGALSTSSTSSFIRFHKEIIYDATMNAPGILSQNRAKVDSTLYASYASDDLRKTLFFSVNAAPANNTYRFKGSYSGSNAGFSGIAVDEVYLMRAECHARAGRVAEAMSDLNALIKKRWKNTVTYPAISANNGTEALNKVLIERRKELLMRGLRWMDVKRLNKEGVNITLRRVIDGQTYLLLPNERRYALPIPEDIIQSTGIPQN